MSAQLDHSEEVEAALARAQPRRQIQKIRYSHDAMIDQIIRRPDVSQGELAELFGYTQGWVSQVMSTDMFKARLEARKGELVDPTIRMTLNERFEAVARRSLDLLQEKLSNPASAVPDNLVLRAVELSSKALGVGGNAPPAPPATDHLTILAGRLLALQGRANRGEIYEQLEVIETVESRPVGGSREEGPVPAHQE